MPSGVILRAAVESDLDRLIEIHTACYPDDRTAEARRLNFVQNGLGRLSDLRVAEQRGRIVGHAFGFSLGAYFGGARVPALGIASVAVAPEARGAGVGGAMVAALEEEARARGDVLAILHAYRHGFYARLGYSDVTPNRRLACDPRAVPREWVTRARAAGVRAALGTDAARIAGLYAECAKRSAGWLDRPESLWTRRLANERRHFFVLDDGGYVALETLQRESHAATRIEVHDLVAPTDDARRVLWGFLGMQAGQASEIDVEIAEGDPILFALTDADGARAGDERVEHDLGRIVAGPMIKMLDPRAALLARGYPREGEAHLDVDGAAMRLTVRGGRAAIDAAAGDALAMSARAVSSIAFGGLRAGDAVRLGLASGGAQAIARAEAIFAGPPFFTSDRF